MLLIIDKQTKKIIENMGTNSLFPCGNLPNLPELPKCQEYKKVHDDSELAKKIMESCDCEVVFGIIDEEETIHEIEEQECLDNIDGEDRIYTKLVSIEKKINKKVEKVVDVIVYKTHAQAREEHENSPERLAEKEKEHKKQRIEATKTSLAEMVADMLEFCISKGYRATEEQLATLQEYKQLKHKGV